MSWLDRLPMIMTRKRMRLTVRDELKAIVHKGIGPTSGDATFWRTLRNLTGDKSLDQPYAQHGWVYAAVQAMARPFSSTPFRLYTDLDSDPVEMGDKFDLFDRPNEYMASAQLWEAWVVQTQTTGESNWVLLGDDGGPIRSDTEVPREIYPCSRDDLKIKLTNNTIEYYETRGGQRLEPHQVIAFRLYNPYGFRGLAPLEAAFVAINADWLAQKWNESFFKKGAQPGGMIEFPLEAQEFFATADQRRQFLDEFEERHREGGRTGMLIGGKYSAGKQAHNDIGFTSLSEMSVQTIAAVFGVPLFSLGIVKDVNRETARESRRLLWGDNLQPKMEFVQAVVDPFLERVGNPRDGVIGQFDTSKVEALRSLNSETIEQAHQLRDLGVPINRVDELLDLGIGPIDGGDVPIVPSGYVRLEDLISEQPEPVSMPVLPPTSPPPPGDAIDSVDDEEPPQSPPARGVRRNPTFRRVV